MVGRQNCRTLETLLPIAALCRQDGACTQQSAVVLNNESTRVLEYKSVVMIGATGAVGSEALKVLTQMDSVARVTVLGRRPLEGVSSEKIAQHIVDLFDPETYRAYLPGHTSAICTLGVGEPSKVSKEQFIKIDKTLPLQFATLCKAAGVEHFQLLSSVGANSKSRSFFLRSKGELEDDLRHINFQRLSLFHPSMILTPENRYGLSQAVVLAVWPLLDPILFGRLRKFRGIKVADLGAAIARNIVSSGVGTQTLEWDDIAKFRRSEIG